MKTPTVDEMQAMFRVHTEAAVKVIVEIMTTGTGAKGEAVRLAAAKEILNRGWGRPSGSKDSKSKATEASPSVPEWRSKDGKTYEELYAEKEAENKAAAAAAEAAAPPPEPSSGLPSSSAPPPPVRNPDPTGYIARRALASAPANASRT